MKVTEHEGEQKREIELVMIGKGDIMGFTKITESFLTEKNFILFKTIA